ncbi:hypothetical protein M2319_002128 [Rhodobium gokarnense]|uniref:Uncharacterized protein n=1 Tax=Rhodobium gokarnense TaxID=364296 RepID=A0ABT3HBL9_9HYPH|nr:hypothetical protein [Rhodobium gokarnense]
MEGAAPLVGLDQHNTSARVATEAASYWGRYDFIPQKGS